MKRQAITLAATAALGFGTLLCNYSRADDKSAPPADSSASGQAVPQAAQQRAQQGADTANAAGAQGGQANLKSALQAANDPDKLFIVMASIDNQCEIQLSQLALQKTQDEHVKMIAQKMVDDHQKAEQDLQQTATAIGIQAPTGVPMTKRQAMTVFQSLNGKQFDQQYISHLRAGHAMAVSEYGDVAQLSQNDQVKQYAQKQLPILQAHLQHVQQAAVALGLPDQMNAQTAGARINGSADQNQNSSGTTSNQNGQSQPNTTAGPQGTGTGQTGGQ